MRPRHWMQLGNATRSQNDLDPTNPKFCMGNLLDLNLHQYVEQVGEIVETADKELKIERKLDTIENVRVSKICVIYNRFVIIVVVIFI